MPKKSYRKAINDAIVGEMNRDPRVVLIGIDVGGGQGGSGEVGSVGGVMGVTSGIYRKFGPDRVIDAVGVDATCAKHNSSKQKNQYQQEMEDVAPNVRKAEKKKWWIGGAPSQALEWGVESVAKAGTMSIIGVYPPPMKSFPIGMAMNKNITLRMGNCNHRKYLPRLVELVRSGVMRPEQFFTQKVPVASAIDAYRHFDQHEHGWLKVKLEPGTAAQ